MAVRPPLAKLFISQKLPAEVEARLGASYDARFTPEDVNHDANGLLAGAAGCDGLLVTPVSKLTAEVIDALPATVRIIATFSVGHEHIDVAAARHRGIAVTNTPDVLTDATADVAMLLMLGAARGASWGERMVREQRWEQWAPTKPLGIHVTGKRLGILGMGRIGQAVAKRARAFNMEIHYHSRTRLPSELECGARFHDGLDHMLPYCDFLSVNCASTPQTRGAIDGRRIGLLPSNAIIVNTARGDIIDDDALISALQSGKLAAAGLDVFKAEPNIDPRFRHLENVFLLPHLGSATLETRNAMGHRAVDNLDAFFSGEHPRDLLAG